MIIRKAPRFILGVSIALIASGAAFAAPQAQQQDQLAEASRAALAQKKAQPKATKVFTDDDLQDIHGTVSVVGNQADNAPADSEDGSKTAKSADKSAGSDTNNEPAWKARFAAARRTLGDDSKELDVLQREYNLKQTQFYSNPDVAMREQFSRKDLNDTLDQINKKKDDVAKDNQKISDLEESLRKAGGDPGWALEPDGKSQDANASDSSDSDRSADASSDSDKLDKADQPEKAERAANDDVDQPAERAESSKSSDDQSDRQTQAQQDNDSAPSDQPQP